MKRNWPENFVDSQISTQMETGDDLELLCAIIIIVETSGYSKARRIETNIVDHDPSTSDQSEKVGQSKEKQTENPKTSSIRCGPDQRSCIFSGYDSVKQNEKTMQDNRSSCSCFEFTSHAFTKWEELDSSFQVEPTANVYDEDEDWIDLLSFGQSIWCFCKDRQ